MKKLLTIALLSIAAITYAQDTEPTYKLEGDLVKATYYHVDGSIHTQGYFKNKKLTGKWVRFDKSGNKTQMAFYKEGKKTGKWFIWGTDSLKEITYNENVIQDVNLWKADTRVASNK
ncbi:nicotinic acid mononucleotide adenyltransferase [uncultured Polaribacter sp.]|uniref:nicotinic acid mononucleotide adenyltransferase n=1 Tax=uncultured Polaribacter sp. TaxID=174711 RepID=UPI002635A678|nr:nicotinic acid mononucleotide adenyltransferase [uncultured Polaribacter sp.]